MNESMEFTQTIFKDLFQNYLKYRQMLAMIITNLLTHFKKKERLKIKLWKKCTRIGI